MTESKPLPLEDFRAAFPGISESDFPDAAVSVYLALADRFFDPVLWSDEATRRHVMGLYAAHYLAGRGSASVGVKKGQGAVGIVSSKSVDGASVSYDTGTASESGAGFWNATPYGKELYRLLRIFGTGAVQL